MTVNELITQLDLLPADAQVVLQTRTEEFEDFTIELVEDAVVLEASTVDDD